MDKPLGTAVFQRLSASPAVSAYKRRAIDEKSGTYCVFDVELSGDANGFSSLASVTIDCYASTETAVEALVAAVHAKMNGWRVQDTAPSAGSSGCFTRELAQYVESDVAEMVRVRTVYTGVYAPQATSAAY
jgi:hypothetical protein